MVLWFHKITSGWHQSRQQLIILSSSTVGMEELCPWVNYPGEWSINPPNSGWEQSLSCTCSDNGKLCLPVVVLAEFVLTMTPTWDSSGDRGNVVTLEPAAFEAGTIWQIQKDQVAFIPILFQLPPKSVFANCSSVLKEWGTVLWSWQSSFTHRGNRNNLFL